LVRDQRLRLQLAEGVEHLVQPVDLALRAVADLAHLPLAALAHLAAHVGLRTLALQLGEVGLELLLPRLDVTVALVLGPLLLDRHLGLDGGQVAVARLGVDRRDQVRREVDDLLEVLGSQVEQVAEPARDTLEVPDVGDRRGQLDVTHPLPAHLGPGDLAAAALADDALEPDPLVLAAVALPVPGRTEDLLAEEPVLLRLERAVVDRLGLLDLAVRPLPDVLAGRQADTELVEEVDVQQDVFSCFPCRWFMWFGVSQGDAPSGGSPCAQTSSTLLGSRRDRSMPSSSAARNTSSSLSRISMETPSLESTSTLRHSDCSSFSRTLNDSGMPGSG